MASQRGIAPASGASVRVGSAHAGGSSSACASSRKRARCRARSLGTRHRTAHRQLCDRHAPVRWQPAAALICVVSMRVFVRSREASQHHICDRGIHGKVENCRRTRVTPKLLVAETWHRRFMRARDCSSFLSLQRRHTTLDCEARYRAAMQGLGAARERCPCADATRTVAPRAQSFARIVAQSPASQRRPKVAM